MARKAKSKSLFVVKVWPVGEKRGPLVTNFSSESEALEYKLAAKRRKDVSFTEMDAYLLNTTAEQALETLDMWIR